MSTPASQDRLSNRLRKAIFRSGCWLFIAIGGIGAALFMTLSVVSVMSGGDVEIYPWWAFLMPAGLFGLFIVFGVLALRLRPNADPQSPDEFGLQREI